MSKEEMAHRQATLGLDFGRCSFHVPIHHLHRDWGEILKVKTV